MILIDGASIYNFISKQFVDQYQLYDYLTIDNGIIEMANGSTINSSSYIKLAYLIQEFSSEAIFYIGQLSSRNNAILGKEWLYENQPQIDWRQNTVILPDSVDTLNVRQLSNIELREDKGPIFLQQKELNQLI